MNEFTVMKYQRFLAKYNLFATVSNYMYSSRNPFLLMFISIRCPIEVNSI